MSPEDKRAREQEFDMLMARAGAVVPADRRAGLIACCDELRRMAALVRQPRTAAAEPSNVFSLKPFVRKS
jgi:hypothetical protein